MGWLATLILSAAPWPGRTRCVRPPGRHGVQRMGGAIARLFVQIFPFLFVPLFAVYVLYDTHNIGNCMIMYHKHMYRRVAESL